MNLRVSGSPSIMDIGNVVVFFPWIGDVLSYFYAGSKIACGSSSFRFNFCRPSRVSQFILILIFEVWILSIFSKSYFVKFPVILVWLLSEFGINVQKQYNFTIFSNKNEKVEILEIWLILIITSLLLL